MSRLQIIVTMPVEELVTPPEDRRYSAPPSGVMPGTVEVDRRCAVHMSTSDSFEDFLAKKPSSWEVVAVQEFSLVQDYDEDGEPVGEPQGVILPVPNTFEAYLPEVVGHDEKGEEISRTPAQSGQPLHIFAGADQWVWGKATSKRKSP